MGQSQSTQQGGRPREFSKTVDDLEFNVPDISKKIKTGDEFEDSSVTTTEEHLIKVQDDGGSGYIVADEERPVQKKTVPVVFHWEHGGDEVFLSGSFNNWKTKVPMTKSGNEHTAIIELPSGTHEFKYYVDGNWLHDPGQKTINDHFDGRNNVITVSDSDFDFTKALMTDETAEKKQHTASFDSSTGGTSPSGSYSKRIPHHGGVHMSTHNSESSHPPSLPPHLLNVILNKETEQEDPTMLPVPHHVALNHLYALSIKDSVMTLSGTHRYKRKYVTTVLYKPVVLK